MSDNFQFDEENVMYAQATLKLNPILRNGAYGIVMRGVQKCTCACASLRDRNYHPLCCIKLDMATEMKDSGIEWVGEIPKEWDIVRTKYNFINHKDIVGIHHEKYDRLALTMQGVVYRSKEDSDGLQPTDFGTYQILRKGELVFKLIDLQNVSTSRIGLSPATGLVSPAYIILSVNGQVLAEFAEKWFLSIWLNHIFNHLGDDGVRSSLNVFDLLNIPICVPSPNEQQLIADYLDDKCAEIDVLAEGIENEIKKLDEYKKSVITEAVTKGLDPNAEMKDSGIEWVGEIPKDWDIVRGKYILKYLVKPVRQDDGVITCFRDGEVTLRSNRREEGFTMADKEIGYQGVDIGDLVVHGMDGFAGAIGISDSRGKASPVLNILDTDESKKYIMYYLRSMSYNNVFTSIATGIRVRSCDLRWNKLAELPYPVPPITIQDKIVKYIDDQIKKTSDIINIRKKQLEVLAEYKKSLIYEYVTGKERVPKNYGKADAS